MMHDENRIDAADDAADYLCPRAREDGFYDAVMSLF
jgi:hypothetical protein